MSSLNKCTQENIYLLIAHILHVPTVTRGTVIPNDKLQKVIEAVTATYNLELSVKPDTQFTVGMLVCLTPAF